MSLVYFALVFACCILSLHGNGESNNASGEDMGGGWIKYWSEEHAMAYYYHEDDEITTWDHPSAGQEHGKEVDTESENIEGATKKKRETLETDEEATPKGECDVSDTRGNDIADRSSFDATEGKRHKQAKRQTGKKKGPPKELYSSNCILIKDTDVVGGKWAMDITTLADHGTEQDRTNPTGCTLRSAISLANTLVHRQELCKLRLPAGILKLERPLPVIKGEMRFLFALYSESLACRRYD